MLGQSESMERSQEGKSCSSSWCGGCRGKVGKVLRCGAFEFCDFLVWAGFDVVGWLSPSSLAAEPRDE